MSQNEYRDELAVARTHLANERTLLAYVRTALAFAAAGAVLFQFFPGYAYLLTIAWALVAAGAVTLVVGGYRFIVVIKKLRRVIIE